MRANSATSESIRRRQVVVADGTEAKPSRRFDKERGTGVWRNGAGRYAISVLAQRTVEITQNDLFVRVAGAGDVSPLAIGRISAATADGQQVSADFYNAATRVGRISSYREGATSFGFKFYGYSGGVMNATPGLVIGATNAVSVPSSFTCNNLQVNTGINVSAGGITAFGNGSFNGSWFVTGTLSVSSTLSGGSVSSSGGISAGSSITNSGGGVGFNGNGSISGTWQAGSTISNLAGGMNIRGATSVVQSVNSAGGGFRLYRADTAQFLDVFVGSDNQLYFEWANTRLFTFHNGAGGQPFIAPDTDYGIDLGAPGRTWGRADFGNVNVQFGLALSTDAAQKPGTSTWQISSDIRTKHRDSIRAYDRGIDALMRLRPVWFRYNGEGGTRDDGREHAGFVAQELAEVAPTMIHDPDADLLQVSLHELFFTLTRALQETYTELQELKREVLRG